MAIHVVKMSIPSTDITRVDVVFSVQADRKKLGELHLSKGDLRWYPRNAKRPKVASWEQFDLWMSS
jgi:hypothetical protein